MDPINRNRIFLNCQDLIESMIRNNLSLIRSSRLDPDDVYQELSVVVLNAIDAFPMPESGSIRSYIWLQMQDAMMELKRRRRSVRSAGVQPAAFGCGVSLRQMAPGFRDNCESLSPQLRQALSRLDASERRAVIRYLNHQRPEEGEAFHSAVRKMRTFYLTVAGSHGCAVCEW